MCVTYWSEEMDAAPENLLGDTMHLKETGFGLFSLSRCIILTHAYSDNASSFSSANFVDVMNSGTAG